MSEQNVSMERLKKLGLRSDLNDKLRRLTNRAQGIIGSLSDATFLVDRNNPFVIDGQKVMDYARELYEVVSEGNRLKGQIEQLEAELGVQ